MPSSLGLAGDLDDVELIQDIEEAFGVRFSDDELNRCWTVGELFDLVEAELPATPGSRCGTAMCFYRLRRALLPVVAAELRPTTPIGALRSLPVRKLQQIIKTCGLRPPLPVLSLSGCVALLLVPTLPIAALAVGSPWWSALLAALPGIALYRIVPIQLPENIGTIGDLVRTVASRSVGALAQEGARLRSTEAWAAFTDIISDHTPLAKDKITPDTFILAPKKAAS